LRGGFAVARPTQAYAKRNASGNVCLHLAVLTAEFCNEAASPLQNGFRQASLFRLVTERLHMTRHEIDSPEITRPKCEACGAPMLLVGRTPPDHDAEHELRTFMCFKCKRKRTVVPTVLDERLHMTGHEVDLREMKRPKCKACGANTTLVRRSPDPDHGARHELRTFMCFKCKRERTASIKLAVKKKKEP
jgi:hypothetical protein